jgi:hypothetical protein
MLHPVSIPFGGKKGGFIAGQAYKFANNPPTQGISDID